MQEQVEAFIREYHMLQPGDRVVVSVSGGPDSVCLLHLLYRMSAAWDLRLHVFHLNHGLRGADAAADADFVQALANSLGVPVTVESLPEGELKLLGGSLQANARTVRYQKLCELAGTVGATRIALGHNRDDQAETVLMRLLRGAGPHGLAGIPPMRSQDGITFIRPLLQTTRADIEKYCRDFELSPRLDESNLSPYYLRNRVRLELLPHLMQAYNPGLPESLAQLAGILRDEDDLLERLALEAFDRCRMQTEGVALAGSTLLSEPPALVRRVIRQAARQVAGPDYDLGLTAVNTVIQALTESHGTRRLDLPGELQVVVEYGICRFEASGSSTAGRIAGEEWNVSLPGETIVLELNLRLTASDTKSGVGDEEVVAFDADKLPGPLQIRTRRPGDRLWPVGMAGSKKLQDILVDAKLPRRLRDRVPVLVAGGEVLWVIGHRVDRRFLATPASKRIVYVQVSELHAGSGGL